MDFASPEGADDEREEGVGILIVSLVFCGPDRLVERALADVVDDADDLFDGVGSKVAVAVFLADGIFAGEVLIGEGLVDDGDPGARGVILLSQETASQKLRLDGFEIVCADLALVDLVVFSVKGMADDADPVGVAVAADGKRAGDGYGGDAGKS